MVSLERIDEASQSDQISKIIYKFDLKIKNLINAKNKLEAIKEQYKLAHIRAISRDRPRLYYRRHNIYNLN